MSDTDNRGPSDSKAPRAGHYKRVLAGQAGAGGGGGFESAGPSEPDLSRAAIADRVAASRAELDRIVKDLLGDKPELYEIAAQIASGGETALKAVADGDEDKLAQPQVSSALEVIVRTDGSRPSFMVRNGDPDRSSSPLGDWGATLDDSADLLRRAVRCIGRINDPSGQQGFQGTGILIGKDMVMTNRHVLQAIGSEQSGHRWQLKPNITIDFGHEFRGLESVGRRKVAGVLFAAAKPIVPTSIDHGKLDLALLELEPGDGAAESAEPLGLDVSPDWGQGETGIFICGYPGNPGPFGNAPSLLERLFQSTFGCKRLAPGLVTTMADGMAESPRKWTLGHDATTLGGNSGSAVFVIAREGVTAGLHYGGTRADPRENWCHVLGLALDEPDGGSGKSLREILKGREARLVDRLGG